MRVLALLLLVLSPLMEVENVKLTFPTQQHEIFVNYANDNFSQKLVYHNDMITADIKNSNYLDLGLNFRVLPQETYIARLDPQVRELILDLFHHSQWLTHYLNNVSNYLKRNIRYTDLDVPQDAEAVFINKRANCVGYANVMTVLLEAAGIKSRLIKGFYLEKGKKNTFIPIPHRWVEIHLPNNLKFFYDPQHQSFSANYIITRDDVNFKRVKKFNVFLVKKSKKVVN
jgi:transglutaminase-like putative cysteine protease